MQRYNRDKRATYNARNRKINTHDTCDGHDTHKRMKIKIHVRYDGYDKSIYIPIIYGKTRNTHAQRYVGMHNIIRDIFPEIDAPHTQHIYRATCEYHKYIPQETYYTRPRYEEETHTIYKRERVKCIIYNNEQEIIHYGIFIRTMEINGKDITYKLHRSDRYIEVKPFIPFTQTINGVDIHEIWRNNVEIYRI